MFELLSLRLRHFVLGSAIPSLLRCDGRLCSLIPGLKGGLVAWISLTREPAPAALFILRLALENRLAVVVEALAFPTGRAHALAAVATGDAPFRSGLAVAADHAFGGLFVVLNFPLVGVVVGAIGVGIRRDVCDLVFTGAAFGRRRWHVSGCRHAGVVVVVVMVMMGDDGFGGYCRSCALGTYFLGGVIEVVINLAFFFLLLELVVRGRSGSKEWPLTLTYEAVLVEH